ncbi:MAG: error-prone DNA polymerase, partial [Acidobacteria bacterium]
MYIELHARSAFSFLEGTSLPEDLIAFCAALHMPAMALLDRNGIYGAPRFHLAATKAGVKAHIGAEISCSPFSYSILSEVVGSHREPRVEQNDRNLLKNLATAGISPLARKGKRKRHVASELNGEFRVPLLVANRTGYQNLCRLITKMKLRANKEEGAVHEYELEEHAAGLICLTGGDEGPLAAALARGGTQEAFRSVLRLVEIFGRRNVYVELQRHLHREEEVRNRVAVEIARALDLPLLATNGVSYAIAKERELCDVFIALRHHLTLASAGRLLARNSERHLKSAQEMEQLFADLPEAIAHTGELSSRLEFALDDLGYEFPKYPVPEGETMMSFLRERTHEGFQNRYGRAANDLKTRARRQI